MSRASALLRLQQTDLAIDQTRSQLSAVEAELAEHGTVERARTEAAEAERRWRQASMALRAAEDAAASQREKLGQVESRLFGGAVHNPKELTELQAEADSLRRYQGSLDDRVLEAMQEAEDAEAAQGAIRTHLELAEAEASGREKDLRRKRESLMVLLEQHNEEREAAVVGISSEDLALYQSLRKGPGSLAVAELVDDTCNACGVTMAASARQGIRSGPGLTRCRQCGRILYAS